jgi:hypothetical protein
MAEKDEDNQAAARSRLLELLEGEDCEWELSERAEREGKAALRWLHNRFPTRWEMVEYVISLLKTKTPLRCAPQGEPPGSTGIAWQMTDAKNIFVKLQICERRIGQEYAYIQSIHESVHAK